MMIGLDRHLLLWLGAATLAACSDDRPRDVLGPVPLPPPSFSHGTAVTQLTFTSNAFVGARPAMEAIFTPPIYDLSGSAMTGEVVFVGRGCPAGSGPSLDDPYLANPSGKIALIERGLCTFVAKIARAHDAGAIGVIVHNTSEDVPLMGAVPGFDPPEIPAVGVALSTGMLLRNGTAPVTASAVASLAGIFPVTTTSDDGSGSLRQALLAANANPGLDLITFNIPAATDGGCAAATGVCSIRPLSTLPTITDPVVIDGYTQPGTSPNTNPPGTGSNAVLKIELDGSAAGPGLRPGLSITAGNSTVRGLVINRFTQHGLMLWRGDDLAGTGGNVLAGNFIGTDASGTTPMGNGVDGVHILHISDNLIGGSVAADRNVVSANGQNGILILGDDATGNRIEGNFIGTDKSGTVALRPGGFGLNAGVTILNASDNAVGGSSEPTRNVVSGNDVGIQVLASTTGTAGGIGNVLQGNYIGTDVTGRLSVFNLIGVFLQGAGNTLGGTAPGERNVISGNLREGLQITGDGNTIQGNYIGTTVDGRSDLGNGEQGVVLTASNNIIGGPTTGAGNVISANDLEGILIGGAGTGNLVQGNLVGTDVSGTINLGNSSDGLLIDNSSNNTIGGATSGARNLLSANLRGVSVRGGATRNLIVGNYIGTDAHGTGGLGNRIEGVKVEYAADNVIGGPIAAARNIISANRGTGIVLSFGATGNDVQGNYIGTDVSGSAALGNLIQGVGVFGSGNRIGGTIAGSRNRIAFNGSIGVSISSDASRNLIAGNAIFSNGVATGRLGIDLLPGGPTPNDAGDRDVGANDLQNFPVLTTVVVSSGGTAVAGTLNSAPSTTFRLELFSNEVCDAAGYGEGETLLGTLSVTTDAAGNAAFTANAATPVPLGHAITATATDPNNNTSEFSACALARAEPGATPPGSDVEVTPPDATTGQPSPVTITFSEVTGSGTTTVQSGTVGGGSGPPPPANFRLGSPPTYYEVQTTATVTPPLTVCITWVEGTYNNENQLKILHYENGAWRNVTSPGYPDIQNNKICGEVNSLSPFLVAESNLAPLVRALTLPTVPTRAGTSVGLSASFTDANPGDRHQATISWGDGSTSNGAVSELNGTGNVSASHVYIAAGLYTVRVEVTDGDLAGQRMSAANTFLIIYDPAAGYLSGVGSITSPAGAYPTNPSLSGTATFGLSAEYLKAASQPSGSNTFQLQLSNLFFKSTSVQEWLVVSAARAYLRGSGTINGSGNYAFLVSALDGQVTGGGGADKMRFKIWNSTSGVVIYDNNIGASDDLIPMTTLKNGSISIQRR